MQDLFDKKHIPNWKGVTGAARLAKTRCRLILSEPFYGMFLAKMDWKKRASMKTIGVYVNATEGIVCEYNEEWVEQFNLAQLYSILKHVAEHVVRQHMVVPKPKDTIQQVLDIAYDLPINGSSVAPKCVSYTGANELPEGYAMVPEGWDANQTWDAFYFKLLDLLKAPPPSKGKGKGDGSEKSSRSKQSAEEQGGASDEEQGESDEEAEDSVADKLGVGKPFDDHGSWKKSDGSEDVREIVKGAVEDAIQEMLNQGVGDVPGHLKEAIEQLREARIDVRQILRQFTGNYSGKKKPSWSRPNRRYPFDYLKGNSRRHAANIVFIVDTSGSIDHEMAEDFFTIVEKSAGSADLHILLWDCAFQGYMKYRRGDWKKIPFAGRGGTDMAAPVEWLINNQVKASAVIMLTDGYVDSWPKTCPMPLIICSTDKPAIPVPEQFQHILFDEKNRRS